jgi:hypothetical protein
MIAWVDEQCRAWGAHRRWLMFGDAQGWAPRSILGKLIEEGPGAGDTSFVSRVPVQEDPPTYVAVSIALQKMKETRQMEMPVKIIHAHYLVKGKASSKAPDLSISVRQYWLHLHAAHAFIAACDAPRDVTRDYIEACAQRLACA